MFKLPSTIQIVLNFSSIWSPAKSRCSWWKLEWCLFNDLFSRFILSWYHHSLSKPVHRMICFAGAPTLGALSQIINDSFLKFADWMLSMFRSSCTTKKTSSWKFGSGSSKPARVFSFLLGCFLISIKHWSIAPPSSFPLYRKSSIIKAIVTVFDLQPQFYWWEELLCEVDAVLLKQIIPKCCRCIWSNLHTGHIFFLHASRPWLTGCHNILWWSNEVLTEALTLMMIIKVVITELLDKVKSALHT